MSFQIHNAQGKAISIADLDKEACELWGKEVHPKNYAYPQHRPEKFDSYADELKFLRLLENWFDKIGYKIHSGTTTWSSLKEEILAPFTEFDQQMIMGMPEIGGFIKLIDHWESKGYVPVQLDENCVIIKKGDLHLEPIHTDTGSMEGFTTVPDELARH